MYKVIGDLSNVLLGLVHRCSVHCITGHLRALWRVTLSRAPKLSRQFTLIFSEKLKVSLEYRVRSVKLQRIPVYPLLEDDFPLSSSRLNTIPCPGLVNS